MAMELSKNSDKVNETMTESQARIFSTVIPTPQMEKEDEPIKVVVKSSGVPNPAK